MTLQSAVHERIPIEAINEFGDLKVRTNSQYGGAAAPGTLQLLNPTGAILDVKAPGFFQANRNFVSGEPQRFTICGQEVTITYAYSVTYARGPSGNPWTGALTVSVF